MIQQAIRKPALAITFAIAAIAIFAAVGLMFLTSAPA